MKDAGTIHDRLSELVKVFGKGKNTVFSKLIGESEANIRGYRTNVVPKQPVLEKIATSFDISSDWLLTGRGEMLRNTQSPEPDSTPAATVPYYRAALHSVLSPDKGRENPHPDAYISFPPFADADRWTDVTGHSMEPLINHGDMVALKQIDDWRDFLLSGEIYCIVTEEYSTVKRVRASANPDMLILEPLNADYDAQEIPCRIIKSVWQVLGCAKKF